MTPRRGEAGRGLGASRDEAPAPSGILAALILGALLLRLIIAYVLLPDSGFRTDIGSYESWALTLAHYGPGGFYQNAGFVDYTPGYLYVLWLVGLVSQALAGLSGMSPLVFAAGLIKVPAMVFDLATGYLVYRAIRPWSGERAALIGAALYLFNPVTWYDSALWGQVDSVGVLVLLGAVLLLVAGWSEAATAAAVLAAVIKPQLGIGLLIVGFVLLGRHFLRPGSGPQPVPGHPLSHRLDRLLGGWFTAEQGPWRLVSSAAVGMAVLFLLITPFDLSELAAAQAPWLPIGGDLGGLLVVVGQAAGEYHYLTINAYNPWALVGPVSFANTWLWNARSDLEPAFGAIPYVAVGALLLVLTLTFLGYQLLRRSDRASIIVMATVIAVAFFVLPTRVHERYLFPAFALGALLAGPSRSWRWWYVALAAANVANLHANLTYPLFGTENVVSLPLGELLRSEGMVTLIAVAHTALFGWALLHLRRAAPEPEAGPELQAEPQPAAGAAWKTEPSLPLLEALRRRIALPSIRADRSRLLHGERPGKVDRLDLVALVLIVVLGLSLRLFRADQPFEMVTLDEVYHARTATEFLQDWRYGIPHYIYEYTHPHLAKYLMAAGIVLMGDDRVVATSDLGGSVRSVAIEKRYVPPDAQARRAGDRLFVATGGSVRVIDLRSRADEVTIPVPASAVALDEGMHRLYIGSGSGVISFLDTASLDLWRAGQAAPEDLAPFELAHLDGPVGGLWPIGPDRVIAEIGDDLASIDTTTGELLARRAVAALGGAVPLDAVTTVVAYPSSVGDPAATAERLAELLDLDAAEVEARLQGGTAGSSAGVTIAGYVSADAQGAVQAAVDDGELSGVEVVERVPLAVADPSGVSIIDGTSLETIGRVPLDSAGRGLAVVGEGSDRSIYAAAADDAVYKLALRGDGPPTRSARLQMPGAVRDVRWNAATNLVHVLGETGTGEPTVYVIEPHAVAVFSDAVLPFPPAGWALDVQPEFPESDRQQALLFGADGRTATVDTGRNAFAWRFPGIVLGVLMAAALYLLARFLFRRRSVALIAAAAALTDGMFFAHSRDAMNDAYAGFFIVAAFAVLAWLYLPAAGKRGALGVTLGLPLVGVLLGLALASKWVAAFAIGAAVLLVLFRSATGRLVALGGMVVLSGLLGYLAVASGNLTFALLLIALTVLMGGAMVSRPVALARDELVYATVAPLAGAAVIVAAMAAGFAPSTTVTIAGGEVPIAAVLAGALVAVGLGEWFAQALTPGRGLVANGDGPTPPPRGWLRPGASRGIPFTYALACLTLLPLLVYVLSYVPWARPWDPDCAPPVNDCPVILPASLAVDGTTIAEGWPPGHRGQTLYDLTIGMYQYHDELRATHPASSPWWAWPFDFKPAWLWQGSYGGGAQAAIFDIGNLVTWWLAVPAVGFGIWQAWRRRSLALAFVAVAFLAQWLSWARIDRVAFQYHYYSALPFAFLFLGYFLAELWHGPSRRTWLLARGAAALAVLFPGLLWLFKDHLCTFAGVDRVNPSSYLCTGVSGSVIVPWAVVATGAVLLVGLGLFAWELLRLGAAGRAGFDTPEGPGIGRDVFVRLGLFAIATGVAATVAPRLVGSGGFTLQGSVGQAWLVGVAYLIGASPLAWLALGMRDPRRLVALALIAAAAWLVLFYPYFAALPLPAGTPYLYQRLLPTFDYSFQFAVNREAGPQVGLFDPQAIVLTVSIAVLVAVGMLLVAQWRPDRASGSQADGAEPARP